MGDDKATLSDNNRITIIALIRGSHPSCLYVMHLVPRVCLVGLGWVGVLAFRLSCRPQSSRLSSPSPLPIESRADFCVSARQALQGRQRERTD